MMEVYMAVVYDGSSGCASTREVLFTNVDDAKRAAKGQGSWGEDGGCYRYPVFENYADYEKVQEERKQVQRRREEEQQRRRDEQKRKKEVPHYDVR